MDADFQISKALNAIDLRMFHALYGGNSVNATEQICCYLRNIGFRKYHILKLARIHVSNAIKREYGLSDETAILDRYGRLESRFLPSASMPESGYYMEPIDSCDYRLLLPESQNEFFDPSFPKPLSFASRQETRPKLKLYYVEQGAVYIDNCGFQVFNSVLNSFYRTASPFCFSNYIVHTPQKRIDGDAVIVADIFDGGNFAHFLFDWLTRISILLCTEGDRYRDATYFAGGIPGKFHDMLLDTACEQIGLRREQIVFPDRALIYHLSGKLSWYSDAFENNTHPGNLMCPLAASFLRTLGDRLVEKVGSASDPPRKIYISRSDTIHRRIYNDNEVRAFLKRRGFHIAELSLLPASDQIQLLSDADIIIAAHGMGLTHLAFNRRQPKVIELFHPTAGTDAYAILARALGCDYRFMIGRPESGTDFRVSIDDLSRELSS